ncbi:hypothetical protein L195_g050910, partial [Trifolium pratense]
GSGGGGCDSSEMEVMWECGGEVLTWRCWICAASVWLMLCLINWLSSIRDSLSG